MIVIDVLDFVAENYRQLVFRLHLIEHPLSNVDRAARQRECIDHVVVRDKVKIIRKMSVRVSSDRSADAADIFFQCLFFRGQFRDLPGILRREFPADFDLLLVAQPREMHGDSRGVALSVGDYIDDSICGNRSGFGAALAPESPASDIPRMAKKMMKMTARLSRYWRMLSRKRCKEETAISATPTMMKVM